MITLKTLTWDDAFSYGADNKLILNENPVTQIVGLNGHGKSSIPLILEEVLYNKNSKGVKKENIPNRHLGKSYNMSIEYEIDGETYTLKLSRASTIKATLFKGTTNISAHTSSATIAMFEEQTGLDFKTFSQIIYQNGTSSLQFLTATDSVRKKFLVELLSLDRYVELFELFKTAHKQVDSKLTSIRASVSEITSWINGAESNDLSVKPVPIVVDNSEDISTAKQTRKSVEDRLNNIHSINDTISKNIKYRELKEAIPSDKLSKDVAKPNTTKLINVSADILSLTNSKTKYQADIRKLLTKSSTKVCGSCGSELDTSKYEAMVRQFQEELKLVEDRLNELLAEKSKLDLEEKEYSEHQQLLAEFEKYSRLIDDSLPNYLEDEGSLKLELKEIDTRIRKLEADVTKSREEERAIIVHNSKVSTILSQLVTYKSKLTDATATLNSLEDEIATLEVLKKAFSPTGLLAYKIENSVKDLELITNEYLAELSDGRFQLSFELNNDKLNVVIYDNGVGIEITALSAGELSRVTTSTLLAIRRLMSVISKTRINVLFLDETIDVLDNYGREKLIEVLMKEDSLNTFIISHSYSHPLVPKIMVTKIDGISQIENG